MGSWRHLAQVSSSVSAPHVRAGRYRFPGWHPRARGADLYRVAWRAWAGIAGRLPV